MLVVASGTTDEDPEIVGNIAVCIDCVSETCVLTASDKDATADNRVDVCSENAVLNDVSAEFNTGIVSEIRDTMDETADSRADVAFVNAVDRTTSTDCNRLTSVESVDEFVEIFKLRTVVAELIPVESEISTVCNEDAAVEIAELNDWLCDSRVEIPSDRTLLMERSVDCSVETAVCNDVEPELMSLTRIEAASENDDDKTVLIELNADTCVETADENEAISLTRVLVALVIDCNNAD